jgi:hypothetical protein
LRLALSLTVLYDRYQGLQPGTLTLRTKQQSNNNNADKNVRAATLYSTSARFLISLVPIHHI